MADPVPYGRTYRVLQQLLDADYDIVRVLLGGFTVADLRALQRAFLQGADLVAERIEELPARERCGS